MKKALVNGKIYTMEGKVLKKGTIIWENGRIMAVGENINLPSDVTTIDAAGKTITPGFIDAHTHLGILEEIYQYEGDDLNEMTEPVTPEMRALDAVNPFDLAFADAVKGGITTIMTGPGSANVIGGTALVMKTGGSSFNEMVLIQEAGVKAAFGENPKRIFAEQKKMPTSRMGIAALLRQALTDAEDYLMKKKKSIADGEIMERDLGMEVLGKVLNREIPLRAHAHRADDILTAIRIMDEYKFKMVIEHGTEAHKLIKELKDRNIPVVVGPTLSNRAKVELAEITWQTALELSKAGITVALTTDHSVIPIQYLPLCAALAVRAGMPEEEALKAITINAARILGLEERIGSIREGKDADFVVMNGHPLDWRTQIEKVIIDGELLYSGIDELFK